jgi:hypothetical protein
MSNESDPLVQQENEKEFMGIAAELKKQVGPKRLKRKLGTTPTTQAWDALTKGLRRLWDQKEPRLTGMPDLATHLRGAVEFTFPIVTYHLPETSRSWEVER